MKLKPRRLDLGNEHALNADALAFYFPFGLDSSSRFKNNLGNSTISNLWS